MFSTEKKIMFWLIILIALTINIKLIKVNNMSD